MKAPHDQENRVAIFSALKTELRRYEKWYTPRTDLDSRYDLWSERDVVVAGRKLDAVLLRQVRQALKAGHALYRERGWA
jgi:hypothetical protein